MPVITLPTTGRDNKKLEKALRKLFPNGDFKYRKVPYDINFRIEIPRELTDDETADLMKNSLAKKGGTRDKSGKSESTGGNKKKKKGPQRFLAD